MRAHLCVSVLLLLFCGALAQENETDSEVIMPHYKLIYFHGRGGGECARQVFALGGQDFEDVRVTKEQFAPLKPKMPFGQLPVLEVDGKKLAQSLAICRYLARQFDFAGKSHFNEAVVDSLADQYTDYRTEIKEYFYTAVGMREGDVAKLKKEALLPARDKFLGFMTKFLKMSPSGFLVGDSVTWVDLLLSEHCATMLELVPEFLDGFPEVKTHMERVRRIPNLKKWIDTRPKSSF